MTEAQTTLRDLEHSMRCIRLLFWDIYKARMSTAHEDTQRLTDETNARSKTQIQMYSILSFHSSQADPKSAFLKKAISTEKLRGIVECKTELLLDEYSRLSEEREVARQELAELGVS